MARWFLLEHRAQLTKELEKVELQKAQLAKKLKAIDVLLEGTDSRPKAIKIQVRARTSATDNKIRGTLKRVPPPHAVRTSPRNSLIGAVQEVALKQPGPFTSPELLAALQSVYPEFHLTETKHISSPLSDLVKRGVLVLDQKRIGSKPNIYRAK